MATNQTNDSCIICTEKHNKLKHKPIKCEYCDFQACRQCCETYIMDRTQATCMDNNCNKQWSRKFLVANFTQKFVNTEWKKNLEKILYDKEKALLPATQPIVEQRKKKIKIENQLYTIDVEIRRLQRRRRALCQEKQNLNYLPTHTNAASHTRHFVRACPDEHCRGFLSTQWKCGLCDMWTCPDCHVVKGPNKDTEHVCNKDDLETAKLLDKDTKPCPKCATGIFKIEGCDQMWCTQCHTAFSWRTGHIETRIHNPHFFEFQRRANNGQAPQNPEQNNFVCGREIDHNTATILCRMLPSIIPKESIDYLRNIIQSMIHLRQEQAPTYRVDDVENNQELRIRFLEREVDEKRFKELVQQANKRHEKKREIGEIIGLFQQTMTEIIVRLVERLKDEEHNAVETVAFHLNEVRGIQTYANECLQEIAKTYGGQAKMIQFYSSIRGNINQKKTRDPRRPVYDRDVVVNVIA